MKRIFASLVLILMVCSIFAQSSKFSPSTKLLLSEYACVTPKGMLHAPATIKNSTQRVLTVVTLNEGAEVSDETFSSLGIDVEKRCGNVVFANVPVNRFEALAENEGVRRINTGGKNTLNNDQARMNTMVDNVHEMTKESSLVADVPEKFRGKGVLVAVIDQEIDFGHPAFRDANGKTRVKLMKKLITQEDGSTSTLTITQDQIDEKLEVTDVQVQEGHGTHVAAIAAGSTAALADDDPAKQLYGMAPEADLLLYEDFHTNIAPTLLAVSDAFDIADKEQRPLVINMSFGKVTALTDGTDDFNVDFSELMKQYNMEGKVICISSSNTGEFPTSAIFQCEKPIAGGDWTLQKKMAFAPQENAVQMEGIPYPAYSVDGRVSFYSTDEEEFAVKYDFVNNKTEEIIASTPIITMDYIDKLDGQPIRLESEPGADVEYKVNMGYAWGTSPANRYFNLIGLYQTFFSVPVRMVASVYTKENGMTINAAVEFTHLQKVEDDPEGIFVEPDFDGSMNESCSSENVISVGSYQSREYFVNHDGDKLALYDEPAGKVSPFSSYRTEKYGFPGPCIIAPGGHVVSAFHHNRKDPQTGGLDILSTSVTRYNGIDYRWGQMSGTSMSCPAVTGIIALWLQADPTLTAPDIREIFKQTADYDEFCKAEPARVGAGKINALRGLQYILSASGIKTVDTGSNSHTTKRLDSRGNIVIEKNGLLYNVVGVRIAK